MLATAANGGQFVRTSGKPLAFLRSRGALVTLALAANGEFIGDKLPFTPSRLSRSSLTGRVVIGGIAGSAIFHDAGQPVLLGAILGAAGAGAGSFTGYHARHALVHATGFPDFVWAVTEDALALSLGLLAIRRYFRA